jgi:hypothetical protein
MIEDNKIIVQGLTGKFVAEDTRLTDAEGETIIGLQICGKLPFAVLLPDGLSEKGLVPKVKPVAVMVEGFAAELRFRQVTNPSQQRYGMVMHMEDIRGDLTYSEFHLWITSADNVNNTINSQITDETGKLSLKETANFSLKFIDHFITAYTEVLHPKKDWIEEPTLDSCSPWFNCKGENTKMETIWSFQTYDCRGTGVMAGNHLNERERVVLQRGCKATKTDATSMSFMRLANRYKSKGDYISSIIYLQTAFEYWIFRVVRTFLLNTGNSVEDTEGKLIYKHTKRGTISYVSREDALKLVLGTKSFVNTTEYKAYTTKVLNIRDSIIHAKSFSIAKEDCEEAFEVLLTINKILNDKVLEKYAEHGIEKPKALIHFTKPEGNNIFDDKFYPNGR